MAVVVAIPVSPVVVVAVVVVPPNEVARAPATVGVAVGTVGEPSVGRPPQKADGEPPVAVRIPIEGAGPGAEERAAPRPRTLPGIEGIVPRWVPRVVPGAVPAFVRAPPPVVGTGVYAQVARPWCSMQELQGESNRGLCVPGRRGGGQRRQQGGRRGRPSDRSRLPQVRHPSSPPLSGRARATELAHLVPEVCQSTRLRCCNAIAYNRGRLGAIAAVLGLGRPS